MALQLASLYADRQTDIEIRDKVLCVSFHPSLPLIAMGTSTSKLKIFDIKTREFKYILVKVGKVIGVAFSSDGCYLASSHAAEPFQVRQIPNPLTKIPESPYKINLWNVSDQFRFVKDSDGISLHDTAPIHTMDFCSSVIYQQISTTGHRRIISNAFTDTDTKKRVKAVRVTLIASGDGDGQVRLWDFVRNKKWPVIRQEYEGFRGHGSCDALSFTTNGDFLAGVFNGVGLLENRHVLCIWRVNHMRKGVANSMFSVGKSGKQRKTLFILQYDLQTEAYVPITAMKFFPARSSIRNTATVDVKATDSNNTKDTTKPEGFDQTARRHLRQQSSGRSSDGRGHDRKLSMHSNATSNGDGESFAGDEADAADQFGMNASGGLEHRIAIGLGTALTILGLKKTLAEIDQSGTTDKLLEGDEKESLESKQRKQHQAAAELMLQNEYNMEVLARAEHDSSITSIDIDQTGYYVLSGEQLPQGTHNDHGVGLWTVVGDAVTYTFLGTHDRDVMDVSFSTSDLVKNMMQSGIPIEAWERPVVSASLDETVRVFMIDFRYGRLAPNHAVMMVERRPTMSQMNKFREMRDTLLQNGYRNIDIDLDDDLEAMLFEEESKVTNKRKKVKEEMSAKQEAHARLVQEARDRIEKLENLKPGEQYLIDELMPLKNSVRNSHAVGVNVDNTVVEARRRQRQKSKAKSSKLLMTFEKFARNSDQLQRKKKTETTRGVCRNCVSFL